MKLGFVRVFVSDFDRSLEFYTAKVGFKVDYQAESAKHTFGQGKVEVSLELALVP